jgi:hypothetical protein
MVSVISSLPSMDEEEYVELNGSEFEYVKFIYIKYKQVQDYFEIYGKAKAIKPSETSKFEWKDITNVKIKIDKLEFIPQPNTVMEVYNTSTSKKLVFRLTFDVNIL